jgi:hypothetical protein
MRGNLTERNKGNEELTTAKYAKYAKGETEFLTTDNADFQGLANDFQTAVTKPRNTQNTRTLSSGPGISTDQINQKAEFKPRNAIRSLRSQTVKYAKAAKGGTEKANHGCHGLSRIGK